MGLPLCNFGGGPSVGPFPVGVLAFGSGGAVGLVSVGGLSAGLLAFGGGAVGVVACGGGAVGLVSVGGAAVGLLSVGGGAFGVVGVGGGAFGVYALGGGAWGRYAFDARRQDAQAVRFFCRHLPRLREMFRAPSAAGRARTAMHDADRYRLLYGPCLPSRCRVGRWLTCRVRGRVKVGRVSDAPIPGR